jgi:hypothetical protein
MTDNLWNDRDAGTQRIQIQFRGLHAIVDDRALGGDAPQE